MANGTMLVDLKPFVKQWYNLSADKLVNKEGYKLTFGEVWAQLIEIWDKVKHAKRDALWTAKICAKRETYKIPELDWCDDQSIKYLAKVCYELSRPDGTFFLSGDDAGEILGRTQKTGRAALKMLGYEKVIKCVKTGVRRRASDYEYIGKPVVATTLSKFEQKKQKMIEDMNRADQKAKKN
ncbi:MAG: hypothetical protein JXB29_12300 [Sedimentisphaerales bacterium]|nr:hypothetical protein [Sedimentisphaerales bacterium]